MSYYTNKVEALMAVAKVLEIQDQVLALKMLRTTSDVIQLFVEPRNPDLVINEVKSKEIVNNYTHKISIATDHIRTKIGQLSSDNFSEDLLKQVKQCSEIDDLKEFNTQLETLITRLKEHISTDNHVTAPFRPD